MRMFFEIMKYQNYLTAPSRITKMLLICDIAVVYVQRFVVIIVFKALAIVAIVLTRGCEITRLHVQINHKTNKLLDLLWKDN